MTLLRTGLALTLAACALPCITTAQTVTFTDPANLRGERVRPYDGRGLPIDIELSGLQQLLRKLNTRASILNIVAHPDDEDGGMLTLYSRGLGARVADLSLTRGEGGQNAMTGDFEDALGLLRTQELLASDRYPGIDQFFGTEVDFGFSKTKEEAFAKWTHDRVLYDAVRAIRIYRPLVITATFIGGVTDGHGQHQVSGQIAQEAFNAAADPKVFPEMIAEGILPWQALKIYARVPMQSITDKGLFDYATGQYAPAKFTNYVTGEVTTAQPSVDVVVHEGQIDPLLTNGAAALPYPEGADVNAFARKPMSYVQFARLGLGLQRSQIGQGVRNAPSGAFDIAYHRYGSKLHDQPTHEDSFFDGIDTSLAGVASLSSAPPAFIRPALSSIAAELAAIARIAKEVHDKQPDSLGLDDQTNSQVGPKLAAELKALDQLIARIESTPFPAREDVLHELRIKRVQLNDALVATFNLYISSDNDGTVQVAGQPLHLEQPPHLVQAHPAKFVFNYGWSANSSGKGMIVKAADVPAASSFALDHPLDFPCNLSLKQIDITRPYFFRDDIEQSVYKLRDPSLRNAPGTPPALICGAELAYEGTTIQLSTISVYSFVPPVNVGLRREKTLALPEGNRSFNVRADLEAQNGKLNPLTFDMPRGWQATPVKSFGNYAEYRIDLPSDLTSSVTIQAKATLAAQDGKPSDTYTEGYLQVGYIGLQSTNYFTAASLRIVPVDVKLPTNRRIAYVPGTGDAVFQTLLSLGIQPTVLWVTDLTPDRLASFDTVILGVRTYNAHPDLHGAPTQALLDYARNGGNVIVQFQTPEFTAADAPYPLTLGRAEVVVDETTPVQILVPDSPVFTTPNKITPADFNNWVEERGHGFLRSWDSHYTALTETHDPGQAPQLGGLITTPLGKGHWTYCAFALYRQLPEAVPGAYRLFANLLNP